MGVFLPYFNLYCYHIDFSELQIGILSGVRILAMVVFSILWGFISDYFINRKTAYIICTIMSAAIWALLYSTTAFYPVLFIILIYSVFYGPIIAFLETFSIETLQEQGASKSQYGHIRVWGSVSFILISIITGKITGVYSLEYILLLILIFSILQAVFSFKLPASIRIDKRQYSHGLKSFLSTQTILFLLVSFLMLASHGTYYGYFSIHLEKAGYNYTFIGIAWALATFSEIFIMLQSKRLFSIFSLRQMILFALSAAALRWIILFLTTDPWAILLSQLLHAATYGIFHIAAILYIDDLSSENTKTFGQIINNATSYGLGMMAGIMTNGFFFEQYGSLLFAYSALTAVTGGFIALTLFRLYPHH